MKNSSILILGLMIALTTGSPIVETRPVVSVWVDSFMWIYTSFSWINVLAFFTSGLYVSISWIMGSITMMSIVGACMG